MSLKTISALLRKYRIRPNHRLGQHFLKEEALMEKLLDALELYPDEDVLEIGSGLGLFTHKIAQSALGVIGIEKDRRLYEIAKEEFGSQKNIQFVLGDFLKLNLGTLLRHFHFPMKVIGNIPYNISTPILFKLLENHFLFANAVVTLQKEVAERLTAKVGTKDFGILTILLGIQSECEKLFDLEPGSFLPPPEVVSTAVRITFSKQSPYVIHNLKLFKKVVKTAFGQRRKTIKNNLKTLLDKGKVNPWTHLQMDPRSRPEQITINQYVALANYLNTL